MNTFDDLETYQIWICCDPRFDHDLFSFAYIIKVLQATNTTIYILLLPISIGIVLKNFSRNINSCFFFAWLNNLRTFTACVWALSNNNLSWGSKALFLLMINHLDKIMSFRNKTLLKKCSGSFKYNLWQISIIFLSNREAIH